MRTARGGGPMVPWRVGGGGGSGNGVRGVKRVEIGAGGSIGSFFQDLEVLRFLSSIAALVWENISRGLKW